MPVLGNVYGDLGGAMLVNELSLESLRFSAFAKMGRMAKAPNVVAPRVWMKFFRFTQAR